MELKLFPPKLLVVLETLNTLAVFVAVDGALEACDSGNVLCPPLVERDGYCSCVLAVEASPGDGSTAPLLDDDWIREDEREEKVRLRLIVPEVTDISDFVVTSRSWDLKVLFDEEIGYFGLSWGALRAFELDDGEVVDDDRDVEKLARVLNKGEVWPASPEGITDEGQDETMGDYNIVGNGPIPGCLLITSVAISSDERFEMKFVANGDGPGKIPSDSKGTALNNVIVSRNFRWYTQMSMIPKSATSQTTSITFVSHTASVYLTLVTLFQSHP